MAASTAELMVRAQVAKAVWPQPGFVVLPAVEAMATLGFWQAGPGSPECQAGLAQLSHSLQPVLRAPDIEASISLPVCSHGHWTWLAVLLVPRVGAWPYPGGSPVCCLG